VKEMETEIDRINLRVRNRKDLKDDDVEGKN